MESIRILSIGLITRIVKVLVNLQVLLGLIYVRLKAPQAV